MIRLTIMRNPVTGNVEVTEAKGMTPGEDICLTYKTLQDDGTSRDITFIVTRRGDGFLVAKVGA